MIYQGLNYVVQQLNNYLKRRFSEQDTKAILSNILDESGNIPTSNRNKVILTLVNLEQETNQQYTIPVKHASEERISQNLPYNFSVDILVSSMFSNYDEALKFLSETIYFFQAKQVFTHENSPGLDPAIQKLSFELIKVNYSEMQSLWTALGAKYLPSVLFKVRMLSFQSGDIQQEVPTVSQVD